MYPYSDKLRPPAPEVPVRVSHPITGRSIATSGIVDSGSGVTVIPLIIIRDLELMPSGQGNVRGVERKNMPVVYYEAYIQVAEYSRGAVNVVGAEFAYLLLGRDILNQFDVTLRGKMQGVEIQAAQDE